MFAFLESYYSLPVWIVEVTALLFAAAVGVGLHMLVQRSSVHARLISHNSVVGSLISVIAVVYGVVLGFVVIIVWQKYDEGGHIAQREQSAAADLYRLARGFPQELQRQVREDLRTYARILIDLEWPAMEHGRHSHECYDQSEKIAYEIISFNPTTSHDANVQSAALSKLSDFLDGRRERLRHNSGVVQPILWWTLILGMVSTIGFSYFFGSESKRIQLAMTAIMCVVVMSMLILVAEYDTPFSGRLRIDDGNWRAFLVAVGSGP